MAELSQDQVLAQLRTRGFEEGFERTPLREFWGVLTDIGGDMRQPREENRPAFLVALYNFGEVEVIETVETYTSPIAQIEIPVSNRTKSPMGYWGRSVDAIINAGLATDIPAEQAKNQDYLIGKRLHVKYTPNHMVPARIEGEWSDRPRNCWELIEIAGEGVPAPAPAPTPAPAVVSPGPKPGEPPVAPPPATPVASATQQALRLLDGKNDQQWHQVVFTDPIVKADAGIVKSIIDKAFLAPMIEAGIVTKDATGVYTVDMTKIPA